MKTFIASLLAIASLTASALLVQAQNPVPSPSPAASASPAKDGAKYTCTMHPEVVQDKPGNCPKCGMKLVEKK